MKKKFTEFSGSNANTKEVFRTVRRGFKRYETESKDWFLVCYSN